MIWELLLYSYLITTGISITVMPIRVYIISIKKYGKRSSIFKAMNVELLCLAPYIGFYSFVYSNY